MIHNLDFRSKFWIFDQKCGFLADFGHFFAFFRWFLPQKITKSQKKENSSYKNLKSNILLDFVRGIFFFLRFGDFLSQKLPQKGQKMVKIGQKSTFLVKNPKFWPKIQIMDHFFVKHVPMFVPKNFEPSGTIFVEALAFSVFFDFFKNRPFFGEIDRKMGKKKNFGQNS